MLIIADIDPRASSGRIDLADEPDIELGGLSVRPAERLVLFNGDRRELQPRVMQVLVALAKVRPGVVSRDRLIEQCWGGRIVGDDALNRCILALRHLAQEFTPQPFAIETVPRVGHRLVENGTAPAATPQPLKSNLWLLAALAVALLLALATGILNWQKSDAADQPASIGVLPFRNIGSGDAYFAEGIGEEILGQLAREPQFRVAGSSASSQAARSANVQDAARLLEVDYVVEGTVQRQGERVRVSAHLVRSSDGTHLWSDSYDGNLDDIFAIQRSIGTAIASSLRRKLVRVPALSGPLVTNGNAYSLYLTARGLIRTRNRRAGPVAVDLLRDALQIDRGYAPAWASLGRATLMAAALKDRESFVVSASEAQGYARHAVRLAPDLAESHHSLGGLMGFGTPEAVTHLRRAAELDPQNPQNIIGLAAANGAIGEFEEELAAYRRAWELDPLWFHSVASLAVALAEFGDRPGAEEIVRRAFRGDEIQQHVLLGKTALASGDYSEAIRRWSIVANANSPRWSDTTRRHRDEVAFGLGFSAGPLVAVPRPLDQRHSGRVWMDNPPAQSVWQMRNRNAMAAAVYRDDNHVAAKLMLGRGRWRELVAAYDGPGGLVGIRRGVRLRVDQLGEAPVAVLALRQSGRAAEADSLLREAAKLRDAVDRRGRVPFWFDADAAALSAVQGRKDEAIAKLVLAMGRGWRHGGSTDLRDIADEPSFRSLRGHPRFEQLRSRLSAHHARERGEAERAVARMSQRRIAVPSSTSG